MKRSRLKQARKLAWYWDGKQLAALPAWARRLFRDLPMWPKIASAPTP